MPLRQPGAVLSYRILSLGDAALTIEFGEVIDRRLLAAVAAALIRRCCMQSPPAGSCPGSSRRYRPSAR